MPRIARPTGRQIRRFGNLNREGPGDPLMKRTLPGSGSSGSGGGGPSAAAGEFFPNFYLHDWRVQQEGNSATIEDTDAHGAITQSSVTQTPVQDSTGTYINYRSDTTASALGGWRSTAEWLQMQMLPEVAFVIKTGNGSEDIADVQIHCALTASVTPSPIVGSPINYVGFLFDDSSSPNWQTLTSDDVGGIGSGTFKNTGVVVTADTRYRLRIKVTATNNVQFYIATGTGSESLVTTHSSGDDFPAAASLMVVRATIKNRVVGTNRDLRIRRVFGRNL